MAAPTKYPEELRERATRLAVDARRDPATRSGALRKIGEQLGINPETLRNWVIQAEVDGGHRPSVTTEDARRSPSWSERTASCAGRTRWRSQADSVSVLRVGGARPPTDVVVDYLEQYGDKLGVEPICRALTQAGTRIAPSTYYAFRTRQPSARAVEDAATTAVIGQVHEANYGVYGARRVHAQVHRQGRLVARCTVERLMRTAGLRGISHAKGPRTTAPGSDHRAGSSPARQFRACTELGAGQCASVPR